jgi:hypothetical protein
VEGQGKRFTVFVPGQFVHPASPAGPPPSSKGSRLAGKHAPMRLPNGPLPNEAKHLVAADYWMAAHRTDPASLI